MGNPQIQKALCAGNYKISTPLFYACLFRARPELDLSIFTSTLKLLLASSFLAQVMKEQETIINSNKPELLEANITYSAELHLLR